MTLFQEVRPDAAAALNSWLGPTTPFLQQATGLTHLGSAPQRNECLMFIDAPVDEVAESRNNVASGVEDRRATRGTLGLARRGRRGAWERREKKKDRGKLTDGCLKRGRLTPLSLACSSQVVHPRLSFSHGSPVVSVSSSPCERRRCRDALGCLVRRKRHLGIPVWHHV